MAISDRITSIEEHIKESYQELEGIGIDTTGVNNNLENIPKLIDGYWETLPKVTGEGTSITLDNTKEGKMKINLKGNTYQKTTTTGLNQFSSSDSIWAGSSAGKVSYTNDTFTFHRDSGADYLVSGGGLKLKTNTNYTLYFDVIENTLTNDFTRVALSSNFTTGSITIPANTTGQYAFILGTGSSLTQTYDLWLYCNSTGTLKTKIMLVEGEYTTSTIPSYEPFIPNSPSPNYPQDIHVVSGDNSIDVCGKNLFTIKNYSKSGYNVKIDNPLKGQSAGTYTISCENLIPIEDGRGCAVMFLNENNQRVGNYFVGYDFGNALYSNTKNLTQEELDAPYMRLDFNNNNATQEGINRAKIMINKGNKTTYEAYKGASYPISLGVENLFNVKSFLTSNNVSYTENSDGGLTFTANGSLYSNPYVFSDTDISVSINSLITNVTSVNFYVELLDSSNTRVARLSSSTPSAENISASKVRFNWGISGNVTLKDTYLTKGDHLQHISTTPIELCKIGTYQDSIVKDNGKWYLNKQIGKVVLNGSENWTKYNNFLYYYNESFILSPTTSYVMPDLISNNFTISTFNDLKNNPNIHMSANQLGSPSNQRGVSLYVNDYYSDVSTLKTWLGTHNTEVYYVLATPTYTEITDSTLLSQLNALAKSYNSQTNISQESNDLASILNATALSE